MAVRQRRYVLGVFSRDCARFDDDCVLNAHWSYFQPRFMAEVHQPIKEAHSMPLSRPPLTCERSVQPAQILLFGLHDGQYNHALLVNCHPSHIYDNLMCSVMYVKDLRYKIIITNLGGMLPP